MIPKPDNNNVIGLTQYYTTRLNWGKDAQRERKKNCHVTQKIGVELKW